MKKHYIMKIAATIKATGCVLDTEYVHLFETEGCFDSHISLLDTSEKLRNGIITDDNKYEIKAVPVSFKSDDKMILINPEDKRGKWYLEHSKDSEVAVFDLILKLANR